MDLNLFILILGMALVTYLPRVLPLILLSRFKIPEIVVTWLSYIPPAILAALLVPSILLHEEKVSFSIDNPYIIAALPTFVVAIYKKNIFLTIITGMLCVWLLNL